MYICNVTGGQTATCKYAKIQGNAAHLAHDMAHAHTHITVCIKRDLSKPTEIKILV